jgi:8-oxo-dGTP pyrophosphatase MutT (NUDIX family)
LVALFEEDAETWLVLTRRAAHMRRNAGDVAFPGGRQEPGETPTETALRESWEEIGLDPGSVTVIGELDHMINLAGIAITPVVGVLPGRPANLRADPAEVDAVLVVKLADLLDAEAYRSERWSDENPRDMHEFDLEGDTIWGATSRVLYRLLDLVLGA